MRYTLTLCDEEGVVLDVMDYNSEEDPNEFEVTVTLRPGTLS